MKAVKSAKAKYVERLLEWARLIAKPAKRLDMTVWRCGTACCAAGWAAQHRPFVADGLKADELGCPAFQSASGYEALGLFFFIPRNAVARICNPAYYEGLSSRKLRAEVVRRIKEAVKEVGR